MCNGELQGAKPSIIDRDRTKMHPLSRALSIAEAMLASRVLKFAAYAVIRTISSFHGKLLAHANTIFCRTARKAVSGIMLLEL